MNLNLNASFAFIARVIFKAPLLLVAIVCVMPFGVGAKCLKDPDHLPSFQAMTKACREPTGMEAISVLMDGYGLLFAADNKDAAENEAVKIIQTAQSVSHLPAPADKNVKRTVFENKSAAVCVSKMQLGAGNVIFLSGTKACSKELAAALVLAGGAWYTPGAGGGIDGASLDFSKENAQGVPNVQHQTFDEEAEIFWNRLCEEKLLAKYKEICNTDLTPTVYQIICENDEAKKDARIGYVEEQKQQTIREILENGFKMAVTSMVENKTLTDENVMNVKRITTRPNGQMEVEMCPKKEELADMILTGLQRGETYKTQNGFVVELKDEIENFLKDYAAKAQQQGEKND